MKKFEITFWENICRAIRLPPNPSDSSRMGIAGREPQNAVIDSSETDLESTEDDLVAPESAMRPIPLYDRPPRASEKLLESS